MKVVVVGGVAGGASAAARVRRIDPLAEILVLDKGQHVSYSNCSLPYYLGGVVASEEALIMMTPGAFKKSHDIEVRVESEVLSIDRENKKVLVRDLLSGKEYEESYDKLVLSPGASPIMPKSIVGIDGDNVFSVRTVNDVVRIKDRVFGNKGSGAAVTPASGDAATEGGEAPCPPVVSVIGGGFVGIEVAENLAAAGAKVRIIEGLDQILQPYDYDMVQILHKELDDHGIELMLNTTLKEIGPDSVKVERSTAARGQAPKPGGGGNVAPATQELSSDFVIMAIGVKPETELAVAAGLEIGETGGIKVTDDYVTSDPDIYAVGDAIEVKNFQTGKAGRLALAGPAQRQARAAADDMYGIGTEQKGVIGSSCIRVFEQNAAATGLNEKTAGAAGIEYDSVMVFPTDKVGIMPDAHYMAFKLLYEVPTGKILGAQAIGKGAVDKRVDVIAAMITMGGTIDDLKELELCYSPLFSTAKDVVNMAALVAVNVRNGVFKQVHVSRVRELVESGAYIVDVREEGEFANGHVKGAHNIPLSQIRQRLDEIPKDRPVYLHCRSSQRSYYAICALKGRGFDNLINISGSFLGISLYEYFNDKSLGREPIVDKYNFN